MTHKAIAERITAQWTDAIQIFAENQLPTDPPPPYVRWGIRQADSMSSDVSAKFERSISVLWFQIFIPEGQGTRQAHEIQRSIGKIFNEARFGTEDGGSLRFQRVKLVYAGKPTGYVQHNVTVLYWEDAQAVNAT